MNRRSSWTFLVRQCQSRPVIGKFALTAGLVFVSIVAWQVTSKDQPGGVANAQPAQNLQPVIDDPLPPDEAAQTMILPEGFQATVFAAEPDVRQPIGFCIDDRGRLWVAEAYSYPKHATSGNDRILILEDTDGDGRADKRTVFYDRLNYVTGIEVGFGGAWVMSPPFFYFIPDRNGDDRPDGPPEVLLDGFGNHANSHNLANGFAWGPDGWLYGTHGRTNWSMLGKPGTPDDKRIRFDGGVYRYHPTRHIWEPFCDGTTNPWGIDWNDWGDAFICNCVNPHLFQVIYGAHYEPWRNRESSQYAYQRIPTIADHLHFIGGSAARGGLGSKEEDSAGGGHAHCGTMIYLGDNWPDSYRNSLFMNNIHGRRINNDILHRKKSGYTASHGRDLMRSSDPWFMGVTLSYGPDGGVFVSDWSDTGECHSVVNTRRETGRIYKILKGQLPSQPVNLARLSNKELVELQSHRNDWFVRHSRRLLQERTSSGGDLTAAVDQLKARYDHETDIPRKLRALWALQAMGQLDERFLVSQFHHGHESIRGWAIRLLCERPAPSANSLALLAALARDDPSPYVRLQLASALQRLDAKDRWDIATRLLGHREDAEDDNLPLMIWYGIEPLVNDGFERFIDLARSSRLPLVTQFIARRVASIPDKPEGLTAIVDALTQSSDLAAAALLSGMLEGLAGRRNVPMPANWPGAFDRLQSRGNDSLADASLQLALVFDDPRAVSALRQRAMDTKQTAKARNWAIEALVAKQLDQLPPLLLKLVADPITRRAAIRGLSEYSDPETAPLLLAGFSSFDAPARQDVLHTLASRSSWAMQLLDAIESNRIPRSDVTAFTARQLNSLKNPQITARIKSIWGELRPSPAEKAKLISSYKNQLSPELIQRSDRSAGRIVFQKMCANCHRFFDAGGNIGPNITGSQRTNLDYLLQTLVDPGAAVAKEYQMQIIETESGRVITGLIVDESTTSLTVQTANEKVIVPKSEIESRTTSPQSMMPDGILQTLSSDQVRNLFAYLMGRDQVELPQ